MSRPARSAFTLVELLVVITIIGMMMALLLPVVFGIRDRANQMTCMNNLHEIGMACLVYETNKQHFPPERTNMTPTGTTISWAATLVSYLGRGDLTVGQSVYMPVYVCPSNPPDEINDGSPPLAFACNAGKNNFDKPTGSMPSDWKDNGVFMEYMKNQMTENVDKAFVNRNDGVATTLLVMETLTAGQWNVYSELLTGIVWPHSYSGKATDDTRVNEPYVLKNVGSIKQSTISSKHSGGANVVFCDSHTIFLSENVEPVIIEYLMTPNGKGVKKPGDPAIVGQTATLPGGKTTFSEADLIGL